MTKKTLYLIDISSYVFRAYYGIRPLQTSKGVPTNATYGVITMLLKLIKEKKPDSIVIVFDSPIPSFRKDLYTPYKANREVPPEDLPVQFDHVREFVEAYPLPHLVTPGYEADDLIATVVSRVQKMKKEKPEVVIVSGDKDLMQLVGPGVSLYDSMRNKKVTPKEVEERFGVGPDKVIDVMALAGDASDNIPGVKGIGGKTASKLIQEWRSLDNLLKNADKVKGKVGETLRLEKDQALLSRKLVTLCQEVPIDAEWKPVDLGAPIQNQLNDIYRKFELISLVKDVGAQHAVPLRKKVSPVKYELVLKEEDLNKWIKKIKKAKNGFCFDTETTGVDPFRAELVGLSLSDAVGSACYIPVAHSYLGCPEQISKNKVINVIRPLMEDPAFPKWAQNGKYDMEVLHREGITVCGLQGDSMIASYLLNPESAHNLDHLAREYLEYQTKTYDEVVGKGETFDQVELDKACFYAAEDADITMNLIEILHKELKEDRLWDCYQKIEIPLVEVLYGMEVHGVLVNIPFLSDLADEFSERLKKLEGEIYKYSEYEFNIQSPKQTAEVLFGKLNLPTQKKTKTGFSTNEGVLTKLARLHPMPRLLLHHRTIAKLKSTFVDQLVTLVHPKTGRIHTSYNQTVTATGRLSSSNPNLQNIPIRTEEGRRIREAFHAPEGFKILSADYSQIELRLLAAFSKDFHLMKAFREGEDVHRITAEKVFGKKGEKITSELRSMAKTVNFGIIYGQSPFGLAAMLEISQSEAKKYIDQFYKQYPFVKTFRDEVLDRARKRGEVRTWMGRRRFVREINSKNGGLRANAERTAFNTIFQGAAADLIKIAMIKIDKKLKEQNRKTKMIMQVHDELVFEVPEDEVSDISKLVKEEMEGAIKCEVPLKVEVGVGKNWNEAH